MGESSWKRECGDIVGAETGNAGLWPGHSAGWKCALDSVGGMEAWLVCLLASFYFY